jgi:hypothetical protein
LGSYHHFSTTIAIASNGHPDFWLACKIVTLPLECNLLTNVSSHESNNASSPFSVNTNKRVCFLVEEEVALVYEIDWRNNMGESIRSICKGFSIRHTQEWKWKKQRNFRTVTLILCRYSVNPSLLYLSYQSLDPFFFRVDHPCVQEVFAQRQSCCTVTESLHEDSDASRKTTSRHEGWNAAWAIKRLHGSMRCP